MTDEKLLTDTAEKIIKLFKEKNVDVSKKDIITAMKELTNDEFQISIEESAKIVTRKFAKRNNIEVKYTPATNDMSNIADLVPGTWVNIEGKVISVSKPDSNRIHQSAIIADNTGSIRVTVWNRKPDEPRVMDMSPGKWYKFSNVIINTFKNTMSIGVQNSSFITEMESKQDDFVVPRVKIEGISNGIISTVCKVVKLFEPKSDKVFQSGYIGDDTGTIMFTIWSSQAPKFKLSEGNVYLFNNISVTTFNDKKSLVIGNDVTPSDETIEVKSNTITINGVLTIVSEGSGIVRRCTVKGCGRVLTNQGFCPDHEIQKDFKYDMRIKGIIDNGYEAKNIYFPMKLVEEISGVTLAEAIKMAENNPLGRDSVEMLVREKTAGRYYIIEGNEINGRVVASSAKPMTLDDMKNYTGLDITVVQSKLEV